MVPSLSRQSCKKAGCESHEDKSVSSTLHGSCISSCLQVPALLSSCPEKKKKIPVLTFFKDEHFYLKNKEIKITLVESQAFLLVAVDFAATEDDLSL